MSDTIREIADRIHEIREISDISADTLARKLNIPLETYQKYENAEEGVPISTLYEIANILGVEMTELLTGSTPRLHNYSYTKAGEAPYIERFAGYRFQSPAYNFANKKIEPLLVTIDPEENKKMSLVTHSGQEFNYVLEGRIKIILGETEIIMSPGDSIYFDPTIPHGQAAVDGKPGKFLTVILHDKGDPIND
jgi:quercetin dioxygenase-like cupin family protein/DNA-binding XRE family transcriptional regulator